MFARSRLGMVGLLMLLVFVVMALTAPGLTSAGILQNPNRQNLSDRFEGPSSDYWFGTDQLGRDLFSRLWWGAQASLLIGFAATAIIMVLGSLIGLVSGYYGGWIDEILMRVTDFFLVVPFLLLVLILAATVPPPGTSISKVVLVIGISLWAFTARLVRSQVLSLKERQFVERARSAGAGDFRIMIRHIFPNAFTLVFAEAILTVAVVILLESFLSFIGIAPADMITWGKTLQEAYVWSATETGLLVWVLMPGLYIVALVLGFTLLGFALDELVNPRLRRR